MATLAYPSLAARDDYSEVFGLEGDAENRRTACIAFAALLHVSVIAAFLLTPMPRPAPIVFVPPPPVEVDLDRPRPPPRPAPPRVEEIAAVNIFADSPGPRGAAPKGLLELRAKLPDAAPAPAAPIADPTPAARPDNAIVTPPAPTQTDTASDLSVYQPSARADALLGIRDNGGSGTGGGGDNADLSSPPRLGGNVAWKCPWPNDPGAAHIDHMGVRLRAAVRADGQATSVTVVSDPGMGFAEQALTCARRHVFVPARDRAGHAVAGTTAPFLVQFDRFQSITK
jgi:hypothetical protein